MFFKKDFKFKGECFLNLAEQDYFNESIKNGLISVFKLAHCKTCKKEIPNTKIYCSLKCYEIDEEKKLKEETTETTSLDDYSSDYEDDEEE